MYNNYSIEKINQKVRPDASFKIIVVGDSGVGKSAISIQGVSEKYNDLYSPTICFEYYWLNYLVNNSTKIRLKIWDTCGQEAFKALTGNFYHDSALAIIVYSITDKTSFERVSEWLAILREQCEKKLKIILVGNKSALENKRGVTYQRALKYQIDNDINYFIETSAKNGSNIEFLFKLITQMLFEDYISNNSKLNDKDSKKIELKLTNYVKEDSNGWCI